MRNVAFTPTSQTEDEKGLVAEGIELHQELLEKLVDVPTPAGLTPRERNAAHPRKQKPIQVEIVNRAKGRSL